MKDYSYYLNKFINENLNTYYDSFREKMTIKAFKEGFSAGAAWMMDMQNKNMGDGNN